MNISVLTYQDNFDCWDSYVENNSDATAYHFSAWGKSVKDAYGFDMFYFEAKNETGEIIGILPCVKMRTVTGKKKISSLPYCDLGFALANTQEIENQLVQWAKSYFKKLKLHCLEYRSTARSTKTDNQEVLPGQKVRMLLELPESSEALMSSFKSKLRSQIRKAEKNGLTYQITSAELTNDQQRSDFYQIIAENMKLLGSPVHSQKWYEKVLNHYGKKAYLAIVYADQVAVGGAIVICTDHNGVIPWASTRSEFNRLAPNMLLYWSVLEEACQRNLKVFDFGRSSFGEGTYNFKKQWGTFPVKLDWQYFEGDQLVTSTDTSAKSKTRQQIEVIWRKLPLALTIRLGSMIRKYISL